MGWLDQPTYAILVSMRDVPIGNRIMDLAYLRDGHTLHTGEALLLAALLHAKGRGRDTKDMVDVQRIMRDRNLDNA